MMLEQVELPMPSGRLPWQAFSWAYVTPCVVMQCAANTATTDETLASSEASLETFVSMH